MTQTNAHTHTHTHTHTQGSWPSSTQKNVDFVNKALDACISLKIDVGIYCGREWPKIFGNWNRFKEREIER